jgi:hypothetical protein
MQFLKKNCGFSYVVSYRWSHFIGDIVLVKRKKIILCVMWRYVESNPVWNQTAEE